MKLSVSTDLFAGFPASRLLLLILLILKFGLPYFYTNEVYELHRDEFLHLDQANHLAAGYLSVPPLTSWVAWLIKALGNSQFWVRFFPALFGALTMGCVWAIVQELKGSWYAQLLAGLVVLFSVMLRLNLLFQPNSFDVLAWTAAYLFLIKYFSSGNGKWLLLLGASIGIGFLNKYNVVFLTAGLLSALLVTPQRKLFSDKYLYYAAALALLIMLPNLLWQYERHFPVVHHMQELSKTQLVNVQRGDFLKEQLLYFFGSIFILLAAFVSFFRYAPFRPFRAIGWSYLFTLLIFLTLRAKGYYAIGLYPVLLGFGSVYLERLLAEGWRLYMRPILPLVIIGSFLPLAELVFPNMTPDEIAARPDAFRKFGMLRWEDGREHALPQDFADMLGWQEMARKAEAAYALVPAADKSKTLILCDNYGQAGAVNYYSAGRLPQAVAFEADYLNWFPEQQEIRNVIRIAETPQHVYPAFFRSTAKIGEIENPYAREKGTGIYLQTGAGLQVRERIYQRLKEERAFLNE